MTPKQLKASILQLAIQGKLVEQRPIEGSGEGLYQKLQSEKQRLIKCGELKRTKSLPDISGDMFPYDVPETWKLCYIDDIAFVTKLAGFEYSEYIAPNLSSRGIPLFKGKNVQNGKIILDFEAFIPIDIADALPRSQIRKRCLLTPYVGTIGNIAIFDGSFRAHLGSNVGKIELLNGSNQYVLEEYVLYYLRSVIGYTELTKYKKATAQESISIDAIRNVIIPLPPLAEQKRIVTKVEALFKYVDECEDSRKELAEKLAEALKRSVLQEAIQGRLVPQDPNDEPASELLKRIKAAKDAKSTKKAKPLPPVTDDEKPFQIPDSWEWVRLGELVSAESGLSYKKEDLSVVKDVMVRVLRGGNILDGGYVFKGDDVFIAKEFAVKRCPIKAFDFVLPAVTSLEHLGKTALFEEDQPNVYAGGFLLTLHLLHQDKWIAKYLLAFFQSDQYHSYCKRIANKSGQAFYNLSREKLCLIPIPIPPLAEQKRIVAKVDSLLKGVGTLKNLYEVDAWVLNLRIKNHKKKLCEKYDCLDIRFEAHAQDVPLCHPFSCAYMEIVYRRDVEVDVEALRKDIEGIINFSLSCTTANGGISDEQGNRRMIFMVEEYMLAKQETIL